MPTFSQSPPNKQGAADPFEAALSRIVEGARHSTAPAEAVQFLMQPMRSFEVSIPIRRDDGSLAVFTGYRVQYNDALGPVKGGTRFHPTVDLADVKALALWMTVKCSLAGIPYGGAKGGVTCDPSQLSKGELEQVARGYIRALARQLGPDLDIPGPDVGATEQVMAWMYDEYSAVCGYNEPAILTGKPMLLGGAPARAEATGLGVFSIARDALRDLGLELNGATVAVQGFGNVGYHAANYFAAGGAKVVAVSDVYGAIYNQNGLDISALRKHVVETGSIVGFAGGEAIDRDDLLLLAVDVLIPAALAAQLHQGNAPHVKAKVIVEGANGPTTPEADEILNANGVTIVPDILANAGGVVVSYFEWVMNRTRLPWSAAEVRERLSHTLSSAYAAVAARATATKSHMRPAAYAVAIDRLAEAMLVRGWIKA